MPTHQEEEWKKIKCESYGFLHQTTIHYIYLQVGKQREIKRNKIK
jgi:hypothetical protein